jgi:hypothetical protein
MSHRRERKKRKFPLAIRHRHVAWAGVVACTGFLATGILLLVGGIREWRIESASVSWPTTQAEITHSEVIKAFPVPRRGAIALAEYRREISVRYAVNGTEYTTDFKLPSGASNTPNPSQRGFSRATNTEYITLYYNPENPREVVLHPGDQAAAVYGMTLGGTLTVLFSMFVFALGSWLSKPRANP